MKKIINTIFMLLAVMLSIPADAQVHKPRVSPPESVTGKLDDATVTINYSSPSVKGRKIWGGLVPYDTVWRAGANEATTFETDLPLRIGGQYLPAGKYGFFIIPGKANQWVAIFNNVADQWGAFKYDKTKDAIRVNVAAQPLDTGQEMLVYKIVPGGFSLTWEMLSVFVPVSPEPVD
ncbi:DUF2911 domain-containing protein [Mucilaginibacter sp. FT3.2]|uniref:DUF2911 domain-containing protein n=1 Tax=Mucilaginibacter sp. FT3.2 TaxID=2723090 RepID=UPI00160DAB88|nr:DUF2911 domain-containing protein [Mucilaginibacter sp. FT3.2]MBB6232866.1 hypothetical protein [Mucilaginibacter sp. FT3.2]